MNQLEERQEIIVLGSGLGGLITGTLLAKNNHNVLLLKEAGYQPTFGKDGYRFTPFSSLSEKRLKPSLLERVSQTLNLPPFTKSKENDSKGQPTIRKLKKEDGHQIILPKARIDIFSQRSLFLKEWKREFPNEASRIEEFYRDLDQTQHLLQKQKSRENVFPFFPIRRCSFIKNIFSFDSLLNGKSDNKLSGFSREFREFIKLQLTFWGNLLSGQFPAALTAYTLLDEIGEFIPNFDLEKLFKEVQTQFLDSGGKAIEIDSVKKVEMKWQKGQTVFLNRERTVFKSKCLIFNAPLHRISPLLGQKGRWKKKGQGEIKPRYVWIPMFLGINEKVIPVGMKDLLISILDLEKSYSDGNLLLLCLSAKGDTTQAPDGHRALTVMSLMELDQWEKTLMVDYQHRILRHLYHLFPFLENHIDFIDFQWASAHVPRWTYPYFLYEAHSDFNWRKEVTPVKLMKNVYFVGKENFPHFGLEGEVFAGLIVAQEILKKNS